MSDSENQFSTFISYLDDDESKRDEWVHLIELNISFVSFLTPGGTKLTYPVSRILKIKQKEVEQ